MTRVGTRFGLLVFACSSAWTSIPKDPSARICVHWIQASITFLYQYALEERILVSQHQTLVGGRAMACLQVLQRFLLHLDVALQLFNVFRAAFAKRGLGLPVALLPFLGGGIYLVIRSAEVGGRRCMERQTRRGFKGRNLLASARLFASVAAGSLADGRVHGPEDGRGLRRPPATMRQRMRIGLQVRVRDLIHLWAQGRSGRQTRLCPRRQTSDAGSVEYRSWSAGTHHPSEVC